MGATSKICFSILVRNFRSYDSEGHTKGVPEFKPPKPIRLQWDLPEAAIEAIEKSYKVIFLNNWSIAGSYECVNTAIIVFRSPTRC